MLRDRDCGIPAKIQVLKIAKLRYSRPVRGYWPMPNEHQCCLCRKPVTLENINTDENGLPVHVDCYVLMLALSAEKIEREPVEGAQKSTLQICSNLYNDGTNMSQFSLGAQKDLMSLLVCFICNRPTKYKVRL